MDEQLAPREVAAKLAAEHSPGWVLELTAELAGYVRGQELERIMRVWRLSRAELGALFGVSRQAVSKWIAGGVPSDRAPQVADVEAITDLLERHLKPTRIAAVVRRRAAGLGDASLIELVTSGRHQEALALTRRMFTFTDVHG